MRKDKKFDIPIKESTDYKNLKKTSALGTIAEIYNYLVEGSTEKLIELCSEEAEFIILGDAGEVPLAGSYKGKQQISAYLDDFFTRITRRRMEIQFHLSRDNHVNTHLDLTGYVPSTRKTFAIEHTHCWEFDGEGKIVKLRSMYDTYSLKAAFTPGNISTVEDFRHTRIPLDDTETGTREVIEKFYAEGFNTVYLDEEFVLTLVGCGREETHEGVFLGVQGFKECLRRILDFSEFKQENTFIFSVCQGNRIDFLIDELLAAKTTGKEYGGTILHSWTVKDGKILGLKSYNNSYRRFKAFFPDEEVLK